MFNGYRNDVNNVDGNFGSEDDEAWQFQAEIIHANENDIAAGVPDYVYNVYQNNVVGYTSNNVVGAINDGVSGTYIDDVANAVSGTYIDDVANAVSGTFVNNAANAVGGTFLDDETNAVAGTFIDEANAVAGTFLDDETNAVAGTFIDDEANAVCFGDGFASNPIRVAVAVAKDETSSDNTNYMARCVSSDASSLVIDDDINNVETDIRYGYAGTAIDDEENNVAGIFLGGVIDDVTGDIKDGIGYGYWNGVDGIYISNVTNGVSDDVTAAIIDGYDSTFAVGVAQDVRNDVASAFRDVVADFSDNTIIAEVPEDDRDDYTSTDTDCEAPNIRNDITSAFTGDIADGSRNTAMHGVVDGARNDVSDVITDYYADTIEGAEAAQRVSDDVVIDMLDTVIGDVAADGSVDENTNSTTNASDNLLGHMLLVNEKLKSLKDLCEQKLRNISNYASSNDTTLPGGNAATINMSYAHFNLLYKELKKSYEAMLKSLNYMEELVGTYKSECKETKYLKSYAKTLSKFLSKEILQNQKLRSLRQMYFNAYMSYKMELQETRSQLQERIYMHAREIEQIEYEVTMKDQFLNTELNQLLETLRTTFEECKLIKLRVDLLIGSNKIKAQSITLLQLENQELEFKANRYKRKYHEVSVENIELRKQIAAAHAQIENLAKKQKNDNVANVQLEIKVEQEESVLKNDDNKEIVKEKNAELITECENVDKNAIEGAVAKTTSTDAKMQLNAM